MPAKNPSSAASARNDFTRKFDCDRHERGHDGKDKFTCEGLLKDGKTTWGCKASFGRVDKLAAHMRSKKGQKYLRPLVLERLQDGNGCGDLGGNMFADQVGGENADALLAAGKELPSFSEFLESCGLDKSVLGLGGGVMVVEMMEDGDESPAELLGSGSIGGSWTPLEGDIQKEDGGASLSLWSISRSNTQLDGDTQKDDGAASLFLGACKESVPFADACDDEGLVMLTHISIWLSCLRKLTAEKGRMVAARCYRGPPYACGRTSLQEADARSLKC